MIGRMLAPFALVLMSSAVVAAQEDPIAALERAVRATPGDASLHERLSQAYAEANRPAAALEAIDAALALQPGNPAYLRAGAVLATWQGDYRKAAGRYMRLDELGAADAETLINMARVLAWSGETDEAVRVYRRYLATHGEASDTWLELARTEAWRGNVWVALGTLEHYAGRFGRTDAYRRELAAVFARGGRPARAIELLEPLITEDPSNFELNVIRVIARAEQRRPQPTFDALHRLRRLRPADPDTRSAERVVRFRLGSSVQPSVSFYSDSDGLTIQRYTPWGVASLASGTQLGAGFEHAVLNAPAGSGLERADAQTSRYDRAWASVGQTLGPVTLEGRAGKATADDRTLTPYAVRAQARSDALMLVAEYGSDFLVASPRTLDLGLTQRNGRVAIEWNPTIRYHVSADSMVQAVSDDNRRWELTATVRRAMARTERVNLDLGASVYALGAKRDLPNGYYDPHRYESYLAVALPYFKINENAGVSVSLAAGVQREAARSSFRFGGHAGIEATVGIYRPWALRAGATATNNRRADSGAFHGYGGSVVLVRRF